MPWPRSRLKKPSAGSKILDIPPVVVLPLAKAAATAHDTLPENLERKLTRLGSTLIDAKRANPIIEPSQDDDGFWFGGGNAVREPHDGSLLVIGRYRDAGDSRTGLTQGTRGR